MWRHAVLLLVGHGSCRRPAAAASTLAHADRLRRSGFFAEVSVGFLDGDEPPARSSADTRGQILYVMPLLMADGQLASEATPRVLAEGWRAVFPQERIIYCAPIGTVPELSAIVARRATALCRTERWLPEATSLLLIAHGSRIRPAAAQQAAAAHAARIGKTSLFASVDVTFLSGPPSPTEWLCERDGNVAVIGLFAGAGGHAQEDVPQALERAAPWRLGRAVYGGPIGAEPEVARAILAQVRRATLAEEKASVASRVPAISCPSDKRSRCPVLPFSSAQ